MGLLANGSLQTEGGKEMAKRMRKFRASEIHPAVVKAHADMRCDRHLSRAELARLRADEPVELSVWLHYLLCEKCGIGNLTAAKLALLEIEAGLESVPPCSTDSAATNMPSETRPVEFIVGDGEGEGSSPCPASSLEEKNWAIKTPSGMTFKFIYPEALLGWKRKLRCYEKLQVSFGGKKWVDFALFITVFEADGDAMAAFERLPAVP